MAGSVDWACSAAETSSDILLLVEWWKKKDLGEKEGTKEGTQRMLDLTREGAKDRYDRLIMPRMKNIVYLF